MPEHPLFQRLRALAERAPIVVAHRGDSGKHPENTLPAFRAALAAGAEMVEFDVMSTGDGELVCFHDDTLDRTTDAVTVLGRRDITLASVSITDLERLDAGAWKGSEHRGASVPTLADALHTLHPHAVAMIERKSGTAEQFVDRLRLAHVEQEVLLQSFDWDFVARVHALAPEIATGVLGEGILTESHLENLPRTGAGLVHWHVTDVTVEMIERLQQLGKLVCVYTANDDVALLGCVVLGIDAITTNHPSRLRELLARGLVAERLGHPHSD